MRLFGFLLATAIAVSGQSKIQTVAGGGLDRVPAFLLSTITPANVATDAAGNVYVTGREENRVFSVDTGGQLHVFAGLDANQYLGDGGPAVLGKLGAPLGVAFDRAGNAYIADSLNRRIRKVAAGTGIITTVAGGGSRTDENVPALTAAVGPASIAVDPAGNVFFSEPLNYERVREVVAATGNVVTVAGCSCGSSAGDNQPAILNFIDPNGIAVDSAGNLYISDAGQGKVKKVVLSTGIMTTIAGTGGIIFSGDNGPALSASLYGPAGLAVDSFGNLLIAEEYGQRIRKVNLSTGIITTIAGSGNQGFSGDGGPASNAYFSYPLGVAADSNGDVFVADSANSSVRKISPAGIITTVVGVGSDIFPAPGGDGYVATSAIMQPQKTAIDSVGNIYISDTYGYSIRKVDALTHIVTTLATGSATGLLLDGAGNIFFIAGHQVKKLVLSTGVISTFGGTGFQGTSGDGGPATQAQFYGPFDLAMDTVGNLYIADGRVRRVDHVTGVITTVAGGAASGGSAIPPDGTPATSIYLSTGSIAIDQSNTLYFPDGAKVLSVPLATGLIRAVAGGDGPALSAFLNPATVAVDLSGNLFIAEAANYRVRKVAAATNMISTVAGTGAIGPFGDGGEATSASLSSITAISLDNAGSLYVSDGPRVRIVTSTPVGQATVTTVPPGLEILVDGTSYPSPQNFSWAVGSAHTISVASQQVDGTRYTFQNWSDSGPASHTVTAASSASTYTASMQVQYLLQLSPAGPAGTVTAVPSTNDGFYSPGSIVQLTAVANSGFSLQSFTGDQPTNGATATVTMNAPHSFNAAFVCEYPWSSMSATVGAAGGTASVTVGAGAGCQFYVQPPPSWVTASATGWITGPMTITFTVVTNTGPARSGTVYIGGNGLFSQPFTITQAASAPVALRFIAVTPCRLADTRTAGLGAPSIAGQTSRDFVVPNSPCNIPATAQAYSLNVAAVPHGALGYLTIWPSGQTQPVVSTLNSDGRAKSNAAIVPAGLNGAISVFASNTTDVVLDINGYFVPASNPAALAYYPLTPCRVADTRNAAGPLGAPFLSGQTARSFPVAGACGVPAAAQAYSMNFTAVPRGTLGYLTAFASGQAQPATSTLNATTGTVTANAAIVPAGLNGAISVFASNDTDLVADINGYFAPAAAGGLSLYNLPPCRVLDSRLSNSAASAGTTPVNILTASCGGSSAAQAYVLNATVVPVGGLGFLTLWPQGGQQPTVSTLNAADGVVTSNMAIVPANNGSFSAFASNPAFLVFDVSGYFAP